MFTLTCRSQNACGKTCMNIFPLSRRVPFRLAHFSPPNSPYPPVRAVVSKDLNPSVDFQTDRWSQRATAISVWRRHPPPRLTLHFMKLDQKKSFFANSSCPSRQLCPHLEEEKKASAHRVDTQRRSSKSKARERTAGLFFWRFFLKNSRV